MIFFLKVIIIKNNRSFFYSICYKNILNSNERILFEIHNNNILVNKKIKRVN